MATDRNSKVNILLWAHTCIKTAKVDQPTKNEMLRLAKASILRDELRGDISAIWKAIGCGPSKVNDLYL